MIDNILSAVLTFSLMAAGTVAVGSELIGHPRGALQVATLPTVTVTGHRLAPIETVTLPTVFVSGCRHAATEVAVETSDAEQRVQ